MFEFYLPSTARPSIATMSRAVSAFHHDEIANGVNKITSPSTSTMRCIKIGGTKNLTQITPVYSQRQRHRTSRRVTLQMTAMTFTFFGCWLPRNILYTMMVLRPDDDESESRSETYETVFYHLTTLSSKSTCIVGPSFGLVSILSPDLLLQLGPGAYTLFGLLK